MMLKISAKIFNLYRSMTLVERHSKGASTSRHDKLNKETFLIASRKKTSLFFCFFGFFSSASDYICILQISLHIYLNFKKLRTKMAFSFKVIIMWNYTLTSLRLCLVPENTKEIKNI